MRGRVDQVTAVDVLPDEVLLWIFDFCVADDESWQLLVHVCRRWRSLVFQSPRRLDLQLFCTPETPAKDILDVWPALPLVIRGSMTSPDTNNIITALGHSNRVCEVNLWDLLDRKSEEVFAVMQIPFPALTKLSLLWEEGHEPALVIPDAFLGGSAPRLRHFKLDGIPFPGLPKLLSTANHLVDLTLLNIPHSGYITPEAIATCLSVSTSLDSFWLDFLSPRSRPDGESRRPPPITRSILPNLTSFSFVGVSNYLEDLVVRIDTPRLDMLSIVFFHRTNFDTPHLAEFISRSRRFEEPYEADMRFGHFEAEVGLLWAPHDYDSVRLRLRISCEELDQQFSSIAQVCTRCLAPFPTVESLRVATFPTPRSLTLLGGVWEDSHDVDFEIESNQWLELLRPFTAVKSLYLSQEFQQSITFVLQELVGGRMMTEILPSLQKIFLENFEPSGPFQEAIGQFVDARQLSGHPIAIFQDCDPDEYSYSQY